MALRRVVGHLATCILVNIGSKERQNVIDVTNWVTMLRTTRAKQCNKYPMPRKLEEKLLYFFFLAILHQLLRMNMFGSLIVIVVII